LLSIDPNSIYWSYQFIAFDMVQFSINAQRLSDTVAHQLEQRILEGILKAGDRLPAEREFALELGVSRPCLREAIQKLASRGLLYSRQGGGTYVADSLHESLSNPWAQMLLSHPDLDADLLEFRALMQTQCAAWAATRATPADLAHLDQALEVAVSAIESLCADRVAEADRGFHQALAEAAHNAFAAHMMSVVQDLIQNDVLLNLSELISVPVASRMLLDQWTAIVEGVRQKNDGAARQAAATHAGFFRETLHQAQRARARREVSELRADRRSSGQHGKPTR
jgi:GntR family transcriptional regulator, transcriptional repressor for pyruvate dehydrogenase complex